MLAAGVRKLPAGLPHAQRAMELANEDVTMEMEHRTTYLATVGTLGPMIGLVGTVYGMIMASGSSRTAGASPQASQLAAGISTALFATLEGIAISIPAIYFYAMFRNRIARLSLEVAMAAEPLLEQFVPGVRAQDPAPAPTQPPMPCRMPCRWAAPSHPHPFAVSAAIAASASGRQARTALPPAEPSSGSGQWRVAVASPARGDLRRFATDSTHDSPSPLSLLKRSMPCRVRPSHSAGVLSPNLTPLLDVVLQLITFFMMLIHFGTRLEGATAAVRLPVAPAALPGSDLTFDRLAVVLDAHGAGCWSAARCWRGRRPSAWWAEQARSRTAEGQSRPSATAAAASATSCRPW